MKTILPSLTCLLVVAVLAGTDILLRQDAKILLKGAPSLAISADPAPSQETADSGDPAATFPLATQAEYSPRITAEIPFAGDGQQLLKAAARRVYRQSSLAAKLRMEVDLFGQQLIGWGSYLQVGEGEDKLLRYEMNVQTEEDTISFLQVADGRFLWIRHEMPEEVDLGRVDLKRLRRELTGSRVSPSSRDPSIWMALGGLYRLLAGLDSNFRFGPTQLTPVGETEMLSLEGTWNPQPPLPSPGAVKPTPTSDPNADDAARDGPHIPQRVHVLLRREDLFPYRIEYFRRDTAKKQQGGQAKNGDSWRSLARIEFHDVNLRAGIDPLRFVYDPDATQIEDRTRAMLDALRPAALQNP